MVQSPGGGGGYSQGGGGGGYGQGHHHHRPHGNHNFNQMIHVSKKYSKTAAFQGYYPRLILDEKNYGSWTKKNF